MLVMFYNIGLQKWMKVNIENNGTQIRVSGLEWCEDFYPNNWGIMGHREIINVIRFLNITYEDLSHIYIVPISYEQIGGEFIPQPDFLRSYRCNDYA